MQRAITGERFFSVGHRDVLQTRFNLFLAAFSITVYSFATDDAAQDLASQAPWLPRSELSVNLFRNPSIGLEYRQQFISVHLGYYPTNFESNETTSFIRTGVSFWYLPARIGGESASSFYSGVSYLYGLDRDYKNKSELIIETGFRW
ncbi:MAG: hypothetical protein IAF08_07050 [Rhizobacter sp.]|nr:hypothetical protein [Chlorobiales bacterium]